MAGTKECYGIIGAVVINMSAMIYAMRMDIVGVIILLVGNIAGQVLFKEAYNK